MAAKYKTFQINCGKCQTYVLTYHKYGEGKGILRLYFHRIAAPEELVGLHQGPYATISDVPHLKCPNCNEVLGIAVESKGNKWAFRMRQGYFHRKLIKKKG